MHITDLTKSLYEFKKCFSRIIKEFDLDSCDSSDDLGYYVEHDDDNPDERFLIYEYYSILESLFDAMKTLKYLSLPIKGEYYLHKNQWGRYACEERTYTCGDIIEAYIYDSYESRYDWRICRIEHNGTDYYNFHYPKACLEGLKIRIRKNDCYGFYE